MNVASTALPPIQALILAGGQGERLFPLTKSRPKPAVPFGGIYRIIDFTLANCLKSGITDAALLTQYRHDELHSYIRESWGELWEQSSPRRQPLICLPPASGKRYRGTADAVLQNLPVITPAKPEYVLILSGDHIYNMDYRKIIQQHSDTDADLTIATVEYPLAAATHFGVVEVSWNFRVTGFQEKPSEPRPLPHRPDRALISMGIYVFKTKTLVEVLHNCSERGYGHDFGHDIIPSLLGSARIYAYDFRDDAGLPQYWRDIGTIDSYHQTSMELVRNDRPFTPYAGCQGSTYVMTHAGSVKTSYGTARVSARVGAGSHIRRTILSPGVQVEHGASVEDCVLMPGVWVGRKARLRRAVVEEGVHIPVGFQAGWDLENDRKHHTVSAGGVVVISNLPQHARTNVVCLFGKNDPREVPARTFREPTLDRIQAS